MGDAHPTTYQEGLNVSTQAETQTVPTSRKGTPTWEIAYLFPEQGEWTERDYLALKTNRLVELSNGCLEFLPMPTPLHQLLMLFVFDQLREYVKAGGLGTVLPAPLPIRLWRGKFREPDLAFFRPERLTDLRHQPDGADLVVEIVSPGEDARERDLAVKREEYAQAGIAEYWIIDPETQRVTVLALEAETYRVHGEFTAGQTADSPLLPGFTLDVAALFSTGHNAGE